LSFDLIVSLVKEKFPNWQAVMLIKSYEEFNTSFSPNSPFGEGNKDRHYYLDYIAGLVSVRYQSIGFANLIDGLKATVNIFGNYVMLVTSIEEKIFALILPKSENLTETYQKFKEVVGKITESGLSQIELKKSNIIW